MEATAPIDDDAFVADAGQPRPFPPDAAMRFARFLIPLLAACSGAAQALSIDGDTQLHAAVGQALSVSVPVSLAGDEVSRLYYRLTPATGLADAEEKAAAAVHASYDPAAQAILLTTASRMTVPAMRLHLEVGAGAVVVSREVTVLFDIPDLSQSAPLDAAAPKQPGAEAAATEGVRSIEIGRDDGQQKAARSFGDAAAAAAPRVAPVAVAKPQLMLAPRPKYFNTYQVKQGDTLTSIGNHFAHAGAGDVDAVMLAIYEANYESFPAGDPQHPAIGAQFGIPDAASIGSEPAYRVAEFRDYLRKPVGEWQVPVNLQRRPAEAAPAAPRETPPWLQPHNLVGAAVLALLLWALSRLFAGGGRRRALAARRAMSAGGGAPVMAPNLAQAAAPPLREPAVELVAPAPLDTGQSEIARLRELLVQQPGRADIRLRLAQRLFEARRAIGFAEVALPLEQVLSPEAWERVRAMGHELLPSDFRFQPQSGLTPAPELVSLLERKGAPQTAPAAETASIDFDFHGEMARVDKARSDVFGKGGGGSA